VLLIVHLIVNEILDMFFCFVLISRNWICLLKSRWDVNINLKGAAEKSWSHCQNQWHVTILWFHNTPPE
jgi:hypothetical protein